ncbi:MAG: SDR family oxidoreductase [Chlamydiae bacterium]|nr:SDR family oxidoreductase [Chlamydiota bacterium]
MKCLVTGGAGFIGSHLTELLLNNAHEVVVIDNLKGGHLKNFSSFMNHPGFTFYQADIRGTIDEYFEGIDWVFHLAGVADIVPSIENPREYIETNVQGTFNVLSAAKNAGVKRFIYAASSSCYGIPDNYPTPETAQARPQYPYALSKYLGEQLVMHWAQVYKMPCLSLRLFNVYGPRARTTGCYGAVFGVFLAQKLHGKPYTVVGNGHQTRDFTYVTDVANAFMRAAESTLSGEIFNVGSGGHYSVNRLVELLGGEKVHIPKRPGEPDCTYADTKNICKALNWIPQVTLEEGVSRLLSSLPDFQDAPLWDCESIEKATAPWFKFLGANVS